MITRQAAAVESKTVPLSARHSDVLLLCLALTSVAGSVVMGSSLAATAAAVSGSLLLGRRLPEAAVAVGLTASLFGGTWSVVASLGQIAVVVPAVVLLLHPERGRRYFPWFAALALALCVWLIGRFLFEGSTASVRPVLVCGAATLAAVLMAGRRDRVVLWIAMTGSVFIVMSLVFGETEIATGRFSGLSGNPNRMTFGVLLLLPFILQRLLRSKSSLERASCVASTVIGVLLLVRSGSEQAIFGITALCVLVFCGRLLRKVPFAMVSIIGSIALLLGIWAVISFGLFSNMSADTRTLSGRTDLYQVGMGEAIDNWLVGSGRVHVETDLGAMRSAHNSFVGLSATGGVLAASIWLVLMAGSARNSIRGVLAGAPASAAGMMIVVSQLVQSVEYVPLTWFIIVSLWVDQDKGMNAA